MQAVSNFPTMSLEEEFMFFVEDAIDGTDITEDELMDYYCNNFLGIAYCPENEEEMMNAVVDDEPFFLNQVAEEIMRNRQL